MRYRHFKSGSEILALTFAYDAIWSERRERRTREWAPECTDRFARIQARGLRS